MARIILTDRFIAAANRIPAAGRKDYPDALIPGLALRVTAGGYKSFVLIARYPLNPKNPTRRALGEYGAITLEEARTKARAWQALIKKGIDPKVEEARQKAQQRRRQVNTFAAVADEFLSRQVKGPAYIELERLAEDLRVREPSLKPQQAWQRVCADQKNRGLVEQSHQQGIAKKREAIRVIKENFAKRWGARPAADIEPYEVAEAIRLMATRGAPYEAHNAFGHLRRLFNWAIGAHEFGIAISPLERLSPKDLIGERLTRARILTDGELRSVWAAAGEMGYPYGPLFRLLILTGQRETEIAEGSWPEINLAQKLWTIPAERMKGRKSQRRTHLVPLLPHALAILGDLPRFTAGQFMFTTTAGQKPVNGFSRAKQRIDKLSGVTNWVIHDLRRTVRTHLSALPVDDIVRELVIAHSKKGLHRVYDMHAYQDEKQRCLALWEERLHSVLAQGQRDPPEQISVPATI